MSKRLIAGLLAGLVFLGGMALAQKADEPDEPPLRLKKKKPRGDKPAEPEKPAKPDAKKKAEKKDEKKTDKPAEDDKEPAAPQEDEKEVYQRVVKNVRNVENRLAKNDLGEGTRQTQRDILKDIESLIHLNDSSAQPNGGQDEQNGEQQNGEQNAEKNGQKNGQSKQGAGEQNGQKQQPGAKKGKGKGKQSSRASRRARRRMKKQSAGQQAGAGQPSGNKDVTKPGGRNGNDGDGGAGGDKANRPLNRSNDLYKREWGHLPPSLRAQMDAYSNPQPFLPKYDDLIKRYYRTIAEQGRRKGE